MDAVRWVKSIATPNTHRVKKAAEVAAKENNASLCLFGSFSHPLRWLKQSELPLFLFPFLFPIHTLFTQNLYTSNSDHYLPKGNTMHYLKFFDEIEKIVLKDELAAFLGVNDDGIIEIGYPDIVKTAGHSCATVAGAYLAALKGLAALYGEETPRRGEIKVELKRATTEENAGVVGCVLSNITGATTDYGFGGIPGGKFNRRGLLFYEAPIETDIRFTRMDTGESIGVDYRPGKVVNPMKILMSAIGPDATEEDKASFPQRFQAMVKTVFDHADEVIVITKVSK
jgi:hypothetical protein